MKEVCEQLERILAEVPLQFLSISEEQSRIKPGPGKWSKKEIVGHLIDSAANNHQRFIRLQIDTDLALPSYKQNEWVNIQQYQHIPWTEIIALWKLYNTHLLHVIGIMDHTTINNHCTIGNGSPVTLGFIAKDYVEHMKHHIHQILS